MVGIDEVGRGAWAGPLLVVAARTKCGLVLPYGLTDSKVLSHTQRELFYDKLLKVCDFGEGWVGSSEIDKEGLSWALRIGALRAVHDLSVDYQESIIIDGPVNFLPEGFVYVKMIIKADLCIPIVSAASVYAKVVRDKFMASISNKYPNYSFTKNVGYGTALHHNAILTYGLTPIHRRSFKPICRFDSDWFKE